MSKPVLFLLIMDCFRKFAVVDMFKKKKPPVVAHHITTAPDRISNFAC